MGKKNKGVDKADKAKDNASLKQTESPEAEVPERDFPIVGVGASAGGVQVLETFFGDMPKDCGMGFVVVQHLDPHHESMMRNLLANKTELRVHDAAEGMRVEANHVYLKPPGKDVTIKDGILHLEALPSKEGIRLPIDTFFRSLARDHLDRAICVVMTGASSDGTLGAKEIKGEGGLVMVQDEKQAQYPQMPRSVIDAGVADIVLPVERMAKELLRYAGHPFISSLTSQTPEEKTERAIAAILMHVRTYTGHDFSLYKRNTIRRRIERRMALHQIPNMDDYKRFLRQNTQEVLDLFDDMTINVTSFFRDREAFQALKEKALRPVLEKKNGDIAFRVWVPGCSTGEEAYSIGMLLLEVADELEIYRDIKVFGTDINAEAIETARSGTFPANITSDVSPERLKRFFSKKGDKYQVDSKIRDIMIFAVHDVTRDPPFSSIDLVSCRNLLIYMNAVLQRRVLPLLRYALKPKGILFLGSSESVGESENIFTPMDKKHNIYRAQPIENHKLVHFQMPERYGPEENMPEERPEEEKKAPSSRTRDVQQLVEKTMLEKYASPSVLLDQKADILYFQGNTGRYLSPPRGEPNFNVFNMVDGELHMRISRGLEEVKKSKDNSLIVPGVHVRHNDDFIKLTVVLTKLASPKRDAVWTLLEFKEEESSEAEEKQETNEASKDPKISELKKRLDQTQMELQATIEELETSNEELKSANEELQANNEELESSKEELQSTNEELETVNTELFKKTQELIQADDDMNNLFATMEVAVVFLDNQLRIKRFTPEAKKIFNLNEKRDIGRAVSDITNKINYDNLSSDAEEVLDKLQRKKVSVRFKNQNFMVRIVPYRSGKNVIDGVLITFLDTTQFEKSEMAARETRSLFYNTMSALWEPVLILDQEYRIFMANRAFYRTFKLSPAQAEGKILYRLDDGRWDIPELRRFVDEIVPVDQDFDGYEITHDFPRIGRKTLRINACPIEKGEERPRMFLLSFRDIT